MQRYFTKEEIGDLSTERKQHVLQAQAETFRHVQEQSQKYFRMLLASGALIIGLAWSDIIQTITDLDGLQQILSSNIVFQNGVAQSAPEIIGHSFQAGILLGIIAGGLLFEGAMTTIWIMKLDGPLPTARRKDTDLEKFHGEEGSIEHWIWENDRRVTESLIYLNRCYTSIWGAIILGFLSLFTIVSTAIGFLPLMGIFNIAALLILPVAVLFYAKAPILAAVHGDEPINLRKRVAAALNRWFDSYQYVGPSAGMKLAIFMIYSVLWGHSIDVVTFWLQFP